MNKSDSLRPTNPMADPSKSQVPILSYDMLMRQSRKMGKLATSTYNATKVFLKTDVPKLHPDAIIFKNSGITSVKKPNASFEALVKYSHEILAAARTIPMPWNLFPDSVIVDRSKVTIIKQSFFWSSETITIRVEDILSVTSSVGPFFGSITISVRIMNSTDHFEIDSFLRKDAIYLKQIIQGYMIAVHSNLDTSSLTIEELIQTLLQLGRDSKV